MGTQALETELPRDRALPPPPPGPQSGLNPQGQGGDGRAAAQLQFQSFKGSCWFSPCQQRVMGGKEDRQGKATLASPEFSTAPGLTSAMGKTTGQHQQLCSPPPWKGGEEPQATGIAP